MRFKSITIGNAFSYYGQKTFEFENSDKPISLIIGENGFGKTSFINSVKIALHGINKDILNIGNQTLTKQDFILGNTTKNFSGMLNRRAKQDGINTVKMSIVIEADTEILSVQRTFTVSENTYTENLSVSDENGELIGQGDDAQDIINSKISPVMARFFFFDGEKIQTIADFTHEEFTHMLEDVLELDIYDQMAKDAETLIRKINKSELDHDLQELTTQKEKQLEDIAIQITKLKNTSENYKLQLADLQTSKNDLESKLKKLRSRFQKPLADAREVLSTLQYERQALIERMKRVTLIQLPLLLNKELKQRVDTDINANYRGKIQISAELLASKKQLLLDRLQQNNNIASIAEAFDAVFQSSNENQSVSFADPHRIEQQYDLLPNENIQELFIALSDNAHQIKEAETEIITLEQKMAEDKKEYESDFNQMNQLTEAIGRQKMQYESSLEHITSLLNEEKHIKSELSKLTIQEHQNDIANAKIKTLRSVIAVSAEMKQKIKTDKRANLEKAINEKFQLLRKEGYEADKILLDEEFNLNIYDVSANAMDILSCSSGQKQIIATALIWGISEYLNEDIPMVIDTPLGRLDETNQSLVLENFYPKVSKQVIILPTPSELKHDGFKPLLEHISQTFLLSNSGSATSLATVNAMDLINTKKYQSSLEIA